MDKDVVSLNKISIKKVSETISVLHQASNDEIKKSKAMNKGDFE